jgi:hypothetical protein
VTIKRNNGPRAVTQSIIKAKEFSTVTFFDEAQKRQVVILYSLAEDGIVREYSNGKWTAFPITEEV